MKVSLFLFSIRARLLLVSLLLLSIPLIGFRFIKGMESFLREGQQQVLVSAAKLLSATLSDRPYLLMRDRNAPDVATEAKQDEERQRILGVFASDTPETAANLGAAYLPSEDIERILNVVSKNTSRIWVVDARARVRGLAGSLAGSSRADKNTDLLQRIFKSVVRPLLRVFGKDSNAAMSEDTSQTQQAVMSQVDRALNGEPTQLWRYLKDEQTVVLSAAQPVWVGDDIVGAVVIEETTHENQSVTTAALESLLGMSFIVFAVGFIVLIAFAWRLAYRVQRLQIEASNAIDPQGRIKGMISGSQSRDELGALARTLEEVIKRLARYNGYLEQMASRLAHELRTPVAVVRSSLDNLRQADSPALANVYIERADEGVKRLALLIARMSEASQLEGMLNGSEKEKFDLVKVMAGCVEGYRLAYPANQFLFKHSDTNISVVGLPDAIAQLLDKLVQNAVDFSPQAMPITISTSRTLKASEIFAEISVVNNGALIGIDILPNLFNSMVSSRSKTRDGNAHLGLGLYVVRLIAEFHGGSVEALNLKDGSGVKFSARIIAEVLRP